jgi:hypothetical protein
MGGHPCWKLFFVALGFVFMGYPVWRITPSNSFAVSTEVSSVSIQQTLPVRLCFSRPPQKFTLSYLGKIILQGASPETDFNFVWRISLPPEGLDLLLKVVWPVPHSRAAVQVKIFQDENVIGDKTFWSEGDLVEIVTVPGREP